MFFDDKPREECGVIGIYAPHEDVATMTYFGLYALQHRGQEATGIAVSDGSIIQVHKNMGLVSQVYTPENLAPLKGDYAIGHTRYSTTGSSSLRNVQPFQIETKFGPLAIAHNGNLVNAPVLRKKLLQKGIGLSSTTDTEIMTMMLAGAEGDTWQERITNTMADWIGAFSIVVLTRKHVFALRDPWGFRPLNLGLLPGGGHAVASECGALRTLGCEATREVNPGEIVQLSDNALKVTQALPSAENRSLCTFEHIYFSRPDTTWDDLSVHQVRVNLGEELAKEAPVTADYVIPVPDSSIPAAIGYAKFANIPFNNGFIKNRYIGRTFIEPTDTLRKHGIRLKFNVIQENILNKDLILIDDSIVRGNTLNALVKLLKDAGARSVHVRITCPPIKHPCFMGVDMGTYAELIAHTRTIEQIRDSIHSDSLHYLSLQGMMRAIGKENGYCNACFHGTYPFEVNFQSSKMGFEG